MKHSHSVFPVSLSLLFLLSGCSSLSLSTNADTSFQDFTKELFRQEVSSTTIGLHYTLQNPANYDLQDCPVTYGSFSTNTSDVCASIENCIAALHTFSPTELSSENKLTYDVLDFYLETAASGSGYLLYQEPLSPVTGIHAQLPVLLSEYQFYNTEDVETYLDLLGKTGEYFDSLIAFEKEKAQAGLFMPDYQVDSISEQCHSFVEMGDDNYLYTTFSERLGNLADAASSSLSEQDVQDYEAQNAKQIQEVILPAYTHLTEEMESLKGSGKNEQGLCYLPDGKNFYEYIVRLSTGISEEIPALQRSTKKQIAEDLAAMEKVLYSTVSSVDVTAILPGHSSDPRTGISIAPDYAASVRFSSSLAANDSSILESAAPSSMLNDLKTKISDTFPSIPDVNTSVKYVPTAMEEYLSPAFYMIPAIDNSSENVIYINKGQTVEGLNLYTTLAHEGYPGHLYQTVYFASKNADPIRSILDFGGYVEGWATYAEMMSYYLAPLTSQDATLFQKNSSVLLGLYALADMGIHYDGWSVTDTAAFFKDYGITDANAVQSIYELIVGDPGNYLKYYLGYLEFYNFKKEISAEMGNKFSQKEFHKAVLDAGPAPFDVMEEYARTELLRDGS